MQRVEWLLSKHLQLWFIASMAANLCLHWMQLQCRSSRFQLMLRPMGNSRKRTAPLGRNLTRQLAMLSSRMVMTAVSSLHSRRVQTMPQRTRPLALTSLHRLCCQP